MKKTLKKALSVLLAIAVLLSLTAAVAEEPECAADEIIGAVIPEEEIIPEEIPAAEEPAEEIPAEEIPTEEPVTLVDIREAPDGLSAILTSVPLGTEMKVQAYCGEWILVECEGVTGYAFRADLGWSDEDEPAEEEPENNYSVTLFTSRRKVMSEGEPVTLTAMTSGFEGKTVMYRWYSIRSTGLVFEADTTDPVYQFTATKDTLSYGWEVEVLVWVD